MRKLIIKNEYVKIESEDDIVIMKLTHELNDIDLVKKVLELRLKVTPKEPYLFLADVTNVKKTTKEARDFLAGKEGSERILAAAIVTNSMLTTSLVNFFLKVSKPLVTTKLFTEEEEAIKWLKTQRINVVKN